MTRTIVIILAMFMSSLFNAFGYTLAAQYLNVIAGVLAAVQLERMIQSYDKDRKDKKS